MRRNAEKRPVAGYAGCRYFGVVMGIELFGRVGKGRGEIVREGMGVAGTAVQYGGTFRGATPCFFPVCGECREGQAGQGINVFFLFWRFVPVALCKARLSSACFLTSTLNPAGSEAQLFDKISVIGRQAALFFGGVATQRSMRTNIDSIPFSLRVRRTDCVRPIIVCQRKSQNRATLAVATTQG